MTFRWVKSAPFEGYLQEVTEGEKESPRKPFSVTNTCLYLQATPMVRHTLFVHGTLESPHPLISKFTKFVPVWLPCSCLSIAEGDRKSGQLSHQSYLAPLILSHCPRECLVFDQRSLLLTSINLSLPLGPEENMVPLLKRCQ